MRPPAAASPRGLFGVPAVNLAKWAFYHLASFEFVFALFLYSNVMKPFLPSLPIDETVILAVLSFPVGFAVILRYGIYVPGVPIVAAGLLLFGWATISLGWSPSRVLGMQAIAYLYTFNLWCLIAGALILPLSRERVIRFLAFILVLSVIVSAYGVAIYVRHGNIRFYSGLKDFGRLYLLWGYAATNGAIIAFTIAIFSRSLGLRQIVAGGLMGICAVFPLVSGARGPLLGVALACLLAVAVGLPRVERHRIVVPRWQIIGLSVMIIAVSYIAFLMMSGVTLNVFVRFSKLADEFNNPDLVSGPNRFAYYAAAYRFWLTAPVVGHGLSSFSVLFSAAERAGAQPHNIILEMLCELGVVGLSLLFLLFWSGMRLITLKRLKQDPMFLCLTMLLAGRLMAAMVSAEIFGQEELFLFLGMLTVRPPARTVAQPPLPEPGRRAMPRSMTTASASNARSMP